MSLMKVVREISVEVAGLGQKIKEARESDRRSLKELAELAGMSPMNWYRIEAEEQTLPESTLRRIEQVLKVNFGVEFDAGFHPKEVDRPTN